MTPSEAVVVKLQTTPQPTRVGPAIITLHLKDGYLKPVLGANIEVEANMTHPGMAPIFSHATEIAAGRYRSQMEFTMPGDWVMLLHIKLESGKRVEERIDLHGVRTH